MKKRLPSWLWGSIIVVTLIVVGFFDWLTGYELDFLLFYFLPVSLAAWFLGLGASLTVAVVSAIIWAGADILAGHEYSSYFYPVWNTLIRLVSFLIIGCSVNKIRRMLVHERRHKEEIKRTFGQYIDPRVLEQFILQPVAEVDGRRVMTVSFADLQGFTGIGEHFTATGLVNLLNRHLTLQAEAVQQQKGIIDKFIGDSVLAFWGPPFTGPEEHPLLACQAALEQLKALETLRAELPEVTGLRKHLPQVNLRIGINTGEVVVGNIGSESARNYTVIGDTVNLGQRIENVNKIYGTQILMGEATRVGAGSAIVAREIDFLVVKGKTEIARIFELQGLKGEVPEANLTLNESFAAALEAYRSQEWDRSETALKSCLELFPEDGPSQLFIKRVHQLRAQPPGEEWDGVFRGKLL
jgi:adenylate cyclase